MKKQQILLHLTAIAALSMTACTMADPTGTDKDMMTSDSKMEDTKDSTDDTKDASDSGSKEKMFMVEIENVSSGDTATPLAPGVWVVHKDGNPIFTNGQKDAGKGLEALAEDGDPSALATSTGGKVFNTPMGDDKAGPATPGKKYTFEFKASPGDKLSFATMYVQSNDGFYATAGSGFDLFSGDEPITGDMSAKIMLWDAGTEKNQEPLKGADQAPRQSGPNTGEAEEAAVMLMSDTKDGFSYPNAIKFTLSIK